MAGSTLEKLWAEALSLPKSDRAALAPRFCAGLPKSTPARRGSSTAKSSVDE